MPADIWSPAAKFRQTGFWAETSHSDTSAVHSSYVRFGGAHESDAHYAARVGVFRTFEQVWFAGNHSDIGGSYAENESRLSDVSLTWMADAASTVKNGIKIDKSELQLYPGADGIQHDERKTGFPVLTRRLRLTWQGKRRDIRDSNAPLHDSVYARFALPGVIHYDAVQPYRPEGLRNHAGLANYYKNIPAPPVATGVIGYIKSFFLSS